MSSDVVVCSEADCSSSDTFLCVKHCQRYVCFDHLQEHHRLYEQERNDISKELRRQVRQRALLHRTLIDENKLNEQEKRDIEIACTEIRRTYEQRRVDYRQLQNESISLLESHSTVKDLKLFLAKLDVAIEREQQRERTFSSGIVTADIKMEPDDFIHDVDSSYNESSTNHVVSNDSSKNTTLSTDEKDNNSEDPWEEEGQPSDGDSSEMGEIDSVKKKHRLNARYFDEHMQDSNEHRKRLSSNGVPISSVNRSVTIYRGACPLTRAGLFGILPVHNIRICDGRLSCVYNHLQSFHYMTARSAYKVCKAILRQRDPLSTVLFAPDDILYNKKFHIACPFNNGNKNPFDCEPKHIVKAPCSSVISRLDMPRHLRDVHRVRRVAALKIIADMRRLLKIYDGNSLHLDRHLFDKHENIIELIDSHSEPTSKRIYRRK